MIANQLPILPLPTKPEFGTDLMQGFTDPNRYETMAHSRRQISSSRSDAQEKLPPVSQLFSRRSVSPFSERFVVEMYAEPSSAHSSPRRGVFTSSHHRQTESNFLQGSRPGNRAQHVVRNKDDQQSKSPEQTRPPYRYRSEINPPSHAGYGDGNRQVYQRPQTTPSAGLYSWPCAQNGSKNSEGSPFHVSGQLKYELPNERKPIPKVVEERMIPGEGVCYIYKDGSHVKKVIDGEPVNAQWGVTKAGKPRKRLAMACMTCREKKIKCDPGDVNCVQCDKAGRVCRFKTIARGLQSEAESPSYEQQARTPSSMSATTDSHHSHSEFPDSTSSPPTRHGSFSSWSSTPKRPSEQHMVTAKHGSRSKKCRLDLNGIVESRAEPCTPFSTTDVSNAHSDMRNGLFEDFQNESLSPLSFDWQHDIFSAQPTVVLHYIELYFTHINCVTYQMFSRELFMSWLQNSNHKSSEELMVIYSMLAMGSNFSSRPQKKSEGSRFANVARYALEKSHGELSLQLAQSRIIMALYYFALGDAAKAFDYSGSAYRVVVGLKLNTEDGVRNFDGNEALDYGLRPHGLAECHRRTFWSAFLMDHYNGFAGGNINLLQKEDCFVRLPCPNDLYDAQSQSSMPYLDNGFVEQGKTQSDPNSPPGTMAYIVKASSIWGDVLGHSYRSRFQPTQVYRSEYDEFYNGIIDRFDSWLSELPDFLQFNPSNTAAAVEGDYAGVFISIHSLYHISCMVLNRRIRHTDLCTATVKRNIQRAVSHAQQYLYIMRTLQDFTPRKRRSSSASFSPPDEDQSPPVILFTTPFAGYATLNAIDVLAAAGSLNALLFADNVRAMNNGLNIVKQLALFWSSARIQKRRITKRIRALSEVPFDYYLDSGAWTFENPMEPGLGPDYDVFYIRQVQEREQSILLEALELTVGKGKVLLMEEGEGRESGPSSVEWD